MGYVIKNNINNGYFTIDKLNNLGIDIYELLEKHNIDLNNYFIIKATRNFKILNVDEIEKYACIFCINKNLISIDLINKWFDFFIINNNPIPYVVKPFPPENVIKLIKFIK